MTMNQERECGATVVISHHIRDGEQINYEAWLKEIGPVCRSYPGVLDLQIVRPIADITAMYTIIIRFETREYLKNWMESKDRQFYIQKVRNLLVKDDAYSIHDGLESFWFMPQSTNPQPPKQWKQFLVTWSAIFILAPSAGFIFDVIIHFFSISANTYIKNLFVSGVVVLLMVYLVMPRYTRLVHRWLYKQ